MYAFIFIKIVSMIGSSNAKPDNRLLMPFLCFINIHNCILFSMKLQWISINSWIIYKFCVFARRKYCTFWMQILQNACDDKLKIFALFCAWKFFVEFSSSLLTMGMIMTLFPRPNSVYQESISVRCKCKRFVFFKSEILAVAFSKLPFSMENSQCLVMAVY